MMGVKENETPNKHALDARIENEIQELLCFSQLYSILFF
jgi:hypothetical protein